jgi:hypothetical protein
MLDKEGLNQLFELLAGHPFLTRLALYHLALNKITQVTLFERSTWDGIFGEHLHRYYSIIRSEEALREMLTKICNQETYTNSYSEEATIYRLEKLGQ